METDPELVAMSTCLAALQGLKPEGQERCLQWLSQKLAVAVFPTNRARAEASQGTAGGTAPSEAEHGVPKEEAVVPELGGLFSKAAPKTGPEKALLVAWYLAKHRGEKELSGQAINKELKHLGHGIANITSAIKILMDNKPALMIQTRKDGSTQQARKTYKVTDEGNRAVTAKMGAPLSV